MSTQQPRENIVLFGGFEVDISQFDLDDRSSNVAGVRIPCIIFIILVVLTVALRTFARVKYVRHVFVDDGTCLMISGNVY